MVWQGSLAWAEPPLHFLLGNIFAEKTLSAQALLPSTLPNRSRAAEGPGTHLLWLPIPPLHPSLLPGSTQHPWASRVQRGSALPVLVTGVRSGKNRALVAGGELQNVCSKAAQGYGKFDG